MKRYTSFLTLSAALAVTACSSGSDLPEATGKGSIRAINAIKSSPEVSFLIEERLLGGIEYRQATSIAEWDDLDYTFNFEIQLIGETESTRIASQDLSIVRDTDYMMLLSGPIAAPTVTLWQTPERDFTGSETTFEARFAHTSDSLGSIDVYFAAAGTIPVLGEQVGTLAFGEILPGADFESGDYVMTITTAGDPADVVMQATESTFIGATQYTFAVFDSDDSTFAPYVVQAYSNGVGGAATSATIADANFPALVEYFNASMALGTVDIYEDDVQASQIVDDLAFRQRSGELPTQDNPNFYVTPFDINSPVQIEGSTNFFIGSRARIMLLGSEEPFTSAFYFPDRRSVETYAKLQIFSATSNFDFVDVYIVEADDVLDEQSPIFAALARNSATPAIALLAGSYDVYVREFAGSENIAGPIRIDVELGDFVDSIIYDTVDPAVVDLEILPDTI